MNFISAIEVGQPKKHSFGCIWETWILSGNNLNNAHANRMFFDTTREHVCRKRVLTLKSKNVTLCNSNKNAELWFILGLHSMTSTVYTIHDSIYIYIYTNYNCSYTTQFWTDMFINFCIPPRESFTSSNSSLGTNILDQKIWVNYN